MKEVILGVCPEDFHDEPAFIEAFQGTNVTIRVEVAELMGAETMVYSEISGQSFVARVDARTEIKPGQQMKLALDINKFHFFDAKTEIRLS